MRNGDGSNRLRKQTRRASATSRLSNVNGSSTRLKESSAILSARHSRLVAGLAKLAALQVRDFNPDAGTVHIRTSKSGSGRHVVLHDEGIALFSRLTAGRSGIELMLRKKDGGRWGKSNQARPMAEACERAKIDPPANFHCLRHTYASLAIMGRKIEKDGKIEIVAAPLLVVAKNLGHSDTRMVERHYGHLTKDYIADAIRAAAPRFGVEADNVAAMVGS